MVAETPTRLRALGALALTSAVIVSYEVLLTRLLSVVTWYGLAFFVLSIAMLGLTAGSLQALRARAAGKALGPWLARRSLLLAGAIIVALATVLWVPLLSGVTPAARVSLLVVAVATTLPMIAGGGIVARLMAEIDAPIGQMYAVDLGGAAAGALIPLALLGPLDGPSAILLMSALAAVCGALVAASGKSRWLSLGATAALVLATVVNNGNEHGLGLRFVKKGYPPREHSAYSFEGWNALSNVRVRKPGIVEKRDALWAGSAMTPKGIVTGAAAAIDGDAGTFVHHFKSVDELDLLKYDVTNTAHWLRPDGQACVIGVGGGRDIASALVFGHSQVLGVEVNPLLVEMLGKLRKESPILSDPRVTVLVGDGRSVLDERKPHCRTLQASLVDTWAATGAGAFAHTEATIYTLEAWSSFLDRVAPDGVVTFSRWYSPKRETETARLTALAVAALLDRGVTDPTRHLAIVGSNHVATAVLSPAPFTDADRATLTTRARELGFTILVGPDDPPRDETLRRVMATRSIDQLAEAGKPMGLDTSAPTDDRPFFFQLLAPRSWLQPSMLPRFGDEEGVIAGNVLATVQLLSTFFAVALVALGLLGPALLRAARREAALPGPRAAVYFGALGAGFMLAEVSLVQRMHVALGHPTYALVVVLAGLLVSSGLGSALSTRLIRDRRRASIAAVVAGALLILLPHVVIGPLARLTAASSLGVRALWTGAASGLVGLALGMLFPSGIRFIARDRGLPLAFALNGITSVLGSVGAIVISMAWGIPASFALAGVIYMIAAWAGPHRWPEVST
jgi:hypothetical protein